MNEYGHDAGGGTGRDAVWRFSHEAMATTFQCVIVEEDGEYAQDAATAIFNEIDLLESELSRFRPGSAISRLNAAPTGEDTYLGPAGCDCLLLAEDVARVTGGAFDVTVGPLFQLWRESGEEVDEAMLDAARARCGWERLKVTLDGLSASKEVDGMLVDLGGIGKGYALDQAAEMLLDWDIGNALLSAGGSTVRAVGSAPGERRGWFVNAGAPGSAPVLLADGFGLSGSGFEVKGEHIIDPRTGRPCSMNRNEHPIVWSRSPGAALSDALSTAFLVMSRKQVDALCRSQHGISAIYATAG